MSVLAIGLSHRTAPVAMLEAAPPPMPMSMPGPPSWMKSVPGASGFLLVWRALMLP